MLKLCFRVETSAIASAINVANPICNISSVGYVLKKKMKLGTVLAIPRFSAVARNSSLAGTVVPFCMR